MISRRALLQSVAAASAALPSLSQSVFAEDAWPSKEIHSICGFPARLRCRRVCAFLWQEARGQARQDRHHRKQGRCVRQYRDRVRREIQAGRLHPVHCAGQLVPGRRAEPVQEARLRPGQRFRARDDAVETAIHSDRVGRQPVQERRRVDGLSQGARATRGPTRRSPIPASSAASCTRPISGSTRSR